MPIDGSSPNIPEKFITGDTQEENVKIPGITHKIIDFLNTEELKSIGIALSEKASAPLAINSASQVPQKVLIDEAFERNQKLIDGLNKAMNTTSMPLLPKKRLKTSIEALVKVYQSPVSEEGKLDAMKHLSNIVDLGENVTNFESINSSVIDFLSDIGGENAVDLLNILLIDSCLENRKKIVGVLGKISGDKAMTLLKDLSKDEHDEIREKVAQALADTGRDQAVAVLGDMTKDRNHFVALLAIRSLGEIGGDQAVSILKDMSKTNCSATLAVLIQALGQMGKVQALNVLEDILKDANSILRLLIVHSLGKIGGDQAVSLLKTLSQDEELMLREEVAIALGETGSDKALAVLRNMSSDTESSVCTNVVVAVGKIGGDQAVDILKVMLSHSNENIRKKLAGSLDNIPGKEKLNLLSNLCRDSHPEVVYTASEELVKFAKSLGNNPEKQAISLLLDMCRRCQSKVVYTASKELLKRDLSDLTYQQLQELETVFINLQDTIQLFEEQDSPKIEAFREDVAKHLVSNFSKDSILKKTDETLKESRCKDLFVQTINHMGTQRDKDLKNVADLLKTWI